MNRHVLIEKKGFYHILKILIIHCFAPVTCANVSYSVANHVLLVKTISGLWVCKYFVKVNCRV